MQPLSNAYMEVDPIWVLQSIVQVAEELMRDELSPGSADWAVYPSQRKELVERVKSKWAKVTLLEVKRFPWAAETVLCWFVSYNKKDDRGKATLQNEVGLKRGLLAEEGPTSIVIPRKKRTKGEK